MIGMTTRKTAWIDHAPPEPSSKSDAGRCGDCVFGFLKDLATVLYRAKNCAHKYDGVKSLLRLMWSVFAGWSFSEDYIKKDVIADMIEAT
jgi:hypothetical protein